MAYRPLEVTVISAKDLNNVNVFSKMEVYAVAMIAGDERSRKRTPVDKEGARNPSWNFTMRFNVFDESRAVLHVELMSERALGDREIGEVRIPIGELLDGWKKAAAASGSSGGGDEKKPATPAQFVHYQVRKNSGKAKGVLSLSYKFGDLVASAPAINPPAQPTFHSYPQPGAPAYPPQPAAAYPSHDAFKGPEPVTAYPAAGSASAYPPPGAYAYPPPGGYGYPHQPPPQHAGYGYPPQPGYGYPPPQQGGYGYGAPPPVVRPPKKSGGGFGMGLGAGLLGGALGGMLIGDMVSDSGGYDAGYDAGFDDGGGFDF